MSKVGVHTVCLPEEDTELEWGAEKQQLEVGLFQGVEDY